MLHSLSAQIQSLLAPALAQRLTLLINHVLSSEPVATEKLKVHAGRRVRLVLDNWPRLLPAAPDWDWRVSPAGLLEWVGDAKAADMPANDTLHAPGAASATLHDLTVRLDASNPAALLTRGLGGQPPQVQVEGDAQFAGDINWLMQNLRWDVAADLERFLGPSLAQPLQQVGRAVAAGVRAALQGAQDLGERLRTWRA